MDPGNLPLRLKILANQGEVWTRKAQNRARLRCKFNVLFSRSVRLPQAEIFEDLGVSFARKHIP